MDIRKDQATLNDDERRLFVEAVLALKNDVPSQLGLSNRYDDYVLMHMDNMDAAHQGPAFGPWHRAFLRSLELDLQLVHPSVTLPYWDWTVHQGTDSASSGGLWSNDFMGGDGDPTSGSEVSGGPFSRMSGSWKHEVKDPNDPSDYLTRSLGSRTPTLPTSENVRSALLETPYDVQPWSRASQGGFRNRLEGWYGAGSVHNRVHVWVGGSMLYNSSPNDPVFFLHHCNVDRLWSQWQDSHPGEPYLPDNLEPTAPEHHRIDDPMPPWLGAVTVRSVLDHASAGYVYDTEVRDGNPSPLLANLNEWNYEHIGRSLEHAHMHGAHGHDGFMFSLSEHDQQAEGHDTEH